MTMMVAAVMSTILVVVIDGHGGRDGNGDDNGCGYGSGHGDEASVLSVCTNFCHPGQSFSSPSWPPRVRCNSRCGGVLSSMTATPCPGHTRGVSLLFRAYTRVALR